MKKILFVAFAALLLAACNGKLSKEEAKKEYISFIEKSTRQVEKAETAEDLQNIAEKVKEEGEAIDERVDEKYQKEILNDPEVQEALQKLMETSFAKGVEVGGY